MWRLMSQQTAAAVRAQLQPTEWSEQKTDHQPREGVPKFEFVAVDVGDGEHLGHEGRVTLTFYNNRLYSMYFEPKDLAGYFRAVEGLPGASLEASQHFRIVRLPSRTRVWQVGTPGVAGSTPAIEWYDDCLREERDSWIRQYA